MIEIFFIASGVVFWLIVAALVAIHYLTRPDPNDDDDREDLLATENRVAMGIASETELLRSMARKKTGEN